METRDEQDRTSWGVRVNTSRWGNPTDWPTWATSRQREKWSQHGLVLWDHQTQQITRLSAAAALQLLNHLRTTEDWREDRLTIGESVTKLFPNQPDRKPEPAILNSMSLSPDQLQEVLARLERRESDLEVLREDGAKDRDRRLAKAYTILLDLAQCQEAKRSNAT
jgi:hypothetical protein